MKIGLAAPFGTGMPEPAPKRPRYKENTMKDRKANRLFCLFGLLVLIAFTAPAALCQDEEEQVDQPKIGDICKKLTTYYKDKRNLDSDAILACFQMLQGRYKDASKSDQGNMVKTVKKLFDIGPQMPDESLLRAAVGLFAEMGKKGKDALFWALKHKNLKIKTKNEESDWRKKLAIQCFIVEAIGFNNEKSSIKPLCKLLWEDEALIVKATCKALSQYSKLPLKERKSIVEELVKVYANINSLSVANPKREDYRERLLQTEVSFNEALRALTLKSFENSVDWQKWYNDNKNKPKW
jgi:hypothetical protein